MPIEVRVILFAFVTTYILGFITKNMTTQKKHPNLWIVIGFFMFLSHLGIIYVAGWFLFIYL